MYNKCVEGRNVLHREINAWIAFYVHSVDRDPFGGVSWTGAVLAVAGRNDQPH